MNAHSARRFVARRSREAILATAVTVVLAHPAPAATPESPEVQQLINKGLEFLADRSDNRLGGKCLIAMAFLKAGHGSDHPRVAEAVSASLDFANRSGTEIARENELYSIGIAAIFLSELDPAEYRPQISSLLEVLWGRQKPSGGWGYLTTVPESSGDTSMTQYAVLALWTAYRAGVPIDKSAAQRVCEWLIRTQDPSGAWGYQAEDPGAGNFNRLPQKEVRPSLAAAGLGSVYVCADVFGLGQRVAEASGSERQGIPAALIPVMPGPDSRRKPVATRALASMIGRTVADGNAWFDKNYSIQTDQWNHYYLYALERYQSFRELAEGTSNPESRWYNDGVQFLRETQRPDGSWRGQSGGLGEVDTAFSVLFLQRSTQQAIKKALLGEGLLRGGRGLPSDMSAISVRRGQLIGKPLTTSVEDFLDVLENPSSPDFERLSADTPIVFESNSRQASAGEFQRMRRLVRHEDHVVRQLAVKALASRRDLDNVPFLIYALSDPDPDVTREARDALRFVSRKLDGFGMPLNPTPQQVEAAIQAWKDWYRSIEPGATFLE